MYSESYGYESAGVENVTNWPLIIFIGSIFVILVLVKIWYKKLKEKDRMQRALDMVTFQVCLPKEAQQHSEEEESRLDFKQIISVAEQMFSSLSGLTNKGFRDNEHVAFEIVAHQKLITFYASCAKSIAPLVEKQIHAYYPAAQIDEVEFPNIFDESAHGEFAIKSFKLEKPIIFPIKTYMKLESDPLNNITNALSKLDEMASGAVQIMVRPMHQKWRRKAIIASKRIQEGHGFTDYSGWRKIFQVINFFQKPQQNQTPYMQQTPIRQQLLEDVAMKANKTGFQTMVRVVAAGPDKASANLHVDNVVAAFSQFGSPNINGLKVKMGDESELVKAFIFKEFIGSPKMILNIEELASIFHFPNRNISTPNIRWLLSRLLPPPPHLPLDGIILGKSVYRGEEHFVRMKEDDRRRHLFMIGKTGVGKTTFLQNMIIQDMEAGKGLCFIDPNGDAYEYLVERIPKNRAEDVVLFDPSDTQRPIGLNLLDWKKPEEKDFLVQQSIQMFYKLFDPNHTGMVGPQFEHWMRNAALTVMSDPGGGTLIDLPRLFTDDAFMKRVIGYVTDPVVKAFWEQQMAKTADFHKSEMYNYFISKFGRFMTNDMMRNIIGQPKSSIDFRDVMDSGKILLVNLSKGKIGDINASLLGMIIVSKIQAAAFSRADVPEEERKDFYMYVDEFQNFTTDTFATILSEARKYRLSLIITNQYIAQLTEQVRDAVIGNAGTLVCYRIGASDAEFMQNEYPSLTVNDFTNLDFARIYCKLLIDGAPTKPFSMASIKNDAPANPQMGASVKKLSSLKYCRDISEIEAEFQQRMQVQVASSPGLNLPPMREAL